MPRPCSHETQLQPGPYQEGTCRLCWLYFNDETYRKLWDGEGVQAQAQTFPAPQPAPQQPKPRGGCGCGKKKREY